MRASPQRRVALITGASRGIGFAVAQRLAIDGFDLSIAARRTDPLVAAAASIERDTVAKVIPIPADITVEDDLRLMAEEHMLRHGRLDALVLAAGVGTAARFDATSLRSLERQFAVNVRGPFSLIQRCLPALRETAEREPVFGAKVIVLASITGVYPEPGLSAYGAMKAALVSLCGTLTSEESDGGVSATAVCPGYVDTAMTEWIRNQIPRERMIPPEDVAATVAMLVGLTRRTVVPSVELARPGERVLRA